MVRFRGQYLPYRNQMQIDRFMQTLYEEDQQDFRHSIRLSFKLLVCDRYVPDDLGCLDKRGFQLGEILLDNVTMQDYDGLKEGMSLKVLNLSSSASHPLCIQMAQSLLPLVQLRNTVRT